MNFSRPLAFPCRFAALVCSLALGFAAPAFAASQTWNPGGAGGGAGRWDASNWGSAAAWTPGNTALFGGTAGAVTLNATTQTVGGLAFNAGGYTLSNGSLTFGGAPTTIATSGGTTTFLSNLLLVGVAGAQITKTGSGTLALNVSNPNLGMAASNAVWTITGGMLSNGIYDSVVSVTGGNNLGAAPSTGAVQVILDAGTLIATANSAAARWIQVNAAGGTLQINTNNSVDGKIFTNVDSSHTLYVGVGSAYASSLTGVISGNGSLTKMDTGNLTLSGNNTFSGGTTLSAGALKFTNVNALGNGTATLANASTLQAGLTGTVTNAISLNSGNVTIDTGAFTSTLSGVISGSGSLVKTGTGTLVIGYNSLPNTFTGGVMITSGTLGIFQGNSLGALPGSTTTQLTFAGNSTLQFEVANPTALNANRAFMIASGVTATIDTQAYNVTINGALGGSGGVLAKAGNGTLTLNGNNTYGGGTVVSAGTLKMGNANAIGPSSTALTLNGGTLDLNGFSKTVGALASTGGSIVGLDLGSGLAAASATISGTTYIGINAASISAAGTYSLITSSGGGLTGTFGFSGAQNLTVPAGSLIVKSGGNFYRVALSNTSGAEQAIVSTDVPSHVMGIMPLGASITAGYSAQAGYNGGGYRTQLYQNLVNDGRFAPNFVGSGMTYPNNLLATAGQGSHEGHFGYTTSSILNNLNADAGTTGNNGGFWLSGNNTATSGANSPAYIPLNVGGNDFSSNNTVTQNQAVKNRYDAIISKVSELRPGATTIVTNQMYRTSAAGSLISTYFNPYIEGIVYNHVLAGQNVQFLDLYTLVTPGNSTAYLSDGIHPTQAGDNIIADAMYQAIANGAAYWTGNQGGEWGTVTVGGGTNWAMDVSRTTDRGSALEAPTDVYFNNSPAPLAVSLSQDSAVRSLNFTSGATASVSVGGAGTLAIGNGGITVQQGTGAHSVAANIALASDQTWGNVSSNPLTISGGVSGSGNLTIAGSYTLYTGDNSTTIASRTVAGSGAIILAGNNTYTGTTTISSGTLILNGTNSSGNVVVQSPGTLGGSGRIAGPLSGSGEVGPGNSAGIFTATRVDPADGLDFNFEFTATGTPAFGNAAASLNDVLRLNDAATPFAAGLTSGNAVSIYLNLATVDAGDTLQGGFFTDRSADFLSSIRNGTFAFYVKGDGNGSYPYNGFDYYRLAEYDAELSINLSAFQVTSASFADGTVANGYISQLDVIPEPATWLLCVVSFSLSVLLRFPKRP